jgi:hypothetical protein
LYHYTISHTISLFRIQGKLEVPQLSREELGGKGLGGCNWPDLNLRRTSESCYVKRREQITTGLIERLGGTVHPWLSSSAGAILNKNDLAAQRMTAENEYHSRVCLVKFPVGDEPFDILRVNGSGDLVVNYHSVGISPYSESDSIRDIVYYFKFLDSPLQPMR